MERGLPIRSISRCIAVLQAVNRHGSMSLMEIARTSKLPYPTSCRIIQTLISEGLVECEPTRKFYRATASAKDLSSGFCNSGKLVSGARPFLSGLTRKFGWPVALTSPVGRSMVIRDTTHDLSALTYQLYPPGSTMPMLESASGRAYFGHLEADERARLMERLDRYEAKSPSLAHFKKEETIARIREDGYAFHDRGVRSTLPGKTSALGVPIHEDGKPVAAVSFIFFSASMEMTEAIERYVPELRKAARSISEALGSSRPDRPVDGADPIPRALPRATAAALKFV